VSASCPSCDFESLARGPDRGNKRRARVCLWMELLCARVLRAAVLGRGLGRVRHGVSARCARAVRVRLPQPSAPATGMDEGAERRLEGHGLVPVLCRCALHARVMAPGRRWLPVQHRAPRRIGAGVVQCMRHSRPQLVRGCAATTRETAVAAQSSNGARAVASWARLEG